MSLAQQFLNPLMEEAGIGFALPLCTFTPNMAKRLATGPFECGVIPQGKFDGTDAGDRLYMIANGLLGNPLGGLTNLLDYHQGTIVFWITPEWSGDNAIWQYIYNSTDFGIYKFTNDKLYIAIRDGSGSFQSFSIDVSAWTPGTTYFVACSWDTKKTIDGVNDFRIGINDLFSYGGACAGVDITPATVINIGSLNAANPGNAVISGLTVWRRVLSDGVYGQPLCFNQNGPIDELAAIFNGGAGVDPCTITGSRDVLFCLPTDCAAGELTGTGQAWSHPLASVLDADAELLWDGGYLSQPYALKFNGQSTRVNCGSDVSLDDIPTGPFTIGMWGRFDSHGKTDQGFLMCKCISGFTNGWFLHHTSTLGFRARIEFATSDAESRTTDFSYIDGKLHYFTLFFNQGVDDKIYLAVDGKWATSYALQNAAAGAYESDAAVSLLIGDDPDQNRTFDGGVGWGAIWAGDHHSHGSDFIPPRTPPTPGGGLIEAWHMNEGTGSTAAAQVNPLNNGVITGHQWIAMWKPQGSPVIRPFFQFDGSSSQITVLPSATINDLPSVAAGHGQITVEGCFRFDAPGAGNAQVIGKGFGWIVVLEPIGDIRFHVYCDTTTAVADTGGSVVILDGKLHHLACTYNEAGDRKPRIFVDGVLIVTGNASVGNYQTDAAVALTIDAISAGYRWKGANGWFRVSDNIRYTSHFKPPSPCNPPAVDGNTMLLIKMDEGAGIVVADSSGNGNDGQITMGNGRWLNTVDLALVEPGKRIYAQGYNVGADDVGDGIGIIANLEANTDYAIIPMVAYSNSRREEARLQVWDVVGAASLLDFDGPPLVGQHTGGDDAASMTCAGAFFPASLVTGKIYNITDGSSGTITAVSGTNQDTIVATLSGGTDNNWDTGDEFMIVPPTGWVWSERVVARIDANTKVEIRILNQAGEGVLTVHQVEVLKSILSGGNIDSGQGDPWIPTYWSTPDLDVGDSSQGTIMHSGAASIQFNVGASWEGIIQTLAVETGKFMAWDIWACVAGAGSMDMRAPSALYAHIHSDPIIYNAAIMPSTAWQEFHGVFREATLANCVFRLLASSGATAGRWADDVSAILLNNVSLTVVPANYDNSLENGGIRVDGSDTLTRSIVGLLSPNYGEIPWSMIFRHSEANFAKFGNAWPAFVRTNTVNGCYIALWGAYDNVSMAFDAGAGPQQEDWIPPGSFFIPGQIYRFRLRYLADRMELYIDHILRIVIDAPTGFLSVPTILYYGSNQNGANQADVVFL